MSSGTERFTETCNLGKSKMVNIRDGKHQRGGVEASRAWHALSALLISVPLISKTWCLGTVGAENSRPFLLIWLTAMCLTSISVPNWCVCGCAGVSLNKHFAGKEEGGAGKNEGDTCKERRRSQPTFSEVPALSSVLTGQMGTKMARSPCLQ